MRWAIVMSLVSVLAFLSFVVNSQLSWPAKLRRLRKGSTYRDQWMVLDDRTEQVRCNFLTAIEWLQVSAMRDGAHISAATHLSGEYLKQYLNLVRNQSNDRFSGVLLTTHQPTVRYLTKDAMHCLVIDHQTGRRMLTCDRRTGRFLNVQDLEEGMVVYQMAYDRLQKRWKLDAFIQELPLNWKASQGKVQLFSSPSKMDGRDF